MMSAFTIVAAGLVCAVGLSASMDGREAGKLYEGQVLEVLTFHDPQSEALFQELQRFEEATGAHVRLHQIRHPLMHKGADWIERKAGYDVVTVDEPYLASMHSRLLPVREWPKPAVHDFPDVDEVWHPVTLEKSSVGGELMGFPVNPNIFLYAFQKDLFSNPEEQKAFQEQYGRALSVPKSAAEFRDLAEFMHRPPNLYGFVPVREASEAGTIELLWVLDLFGQTLVDEQLNPVFDPARAGEALEWYRGLLQFAPASGEDWHYEARSDFLRTGRLAHGMVWPAYIPDVLDPADSQVLARLGFAEGPSGPNGEPVNLTGFWTIAISKRSDQMSLGAEFAAFWSQRKTNVRLMRRGGAPSCWDVLTDARLENALPWADSYEKAIRNTVSRLSVPGYREVSARIATIFDDFSEGRISTDEAVEGLQSIGNAPEERF